jgi:hypothetical protein
LNVSGKSTEPASLISNPQQNQQKALQTSTNPNTSSQAPRPPSFAQPTLAWQQRRSHESAHPASTAAVATRRAALSHLTNPERSEHDGYDSDSS